jgi:hypothetical protein
MENSESPLEDDTGLDVIVTPPNESNETALSPVLESDTDVSRRLFSPQNGKAVDPNARSIAPAVDDMFMKDWISGHPCMGMDGNPLKSGHKRGKCADCGYCRVCPLVPPWCKGKANHGSLSISKSGKKRSNDCDEVTLPRAKRVASILARDKLAQSKEADVELEQMIEQEDKDVDNLNSLEHKLEDILHQLQEATDQQEKSRLMRSVVCQAAKAISKSKNEEEEIISSTVSGLAQVYSRSERDDVSSKVLNCVVNLCIQGSTQTKRICNAILLHSAPTKAASQLLLHAGWGRRRREQVMTNKQAVNESKARNAERLNRPISNPKEATVGLKFSAPWSNSLCAANARKNHNNYLVQGKDIPPPIKTTKISIQSMDFVVSWICDNSQCRPGRTRNVRVHGELLRELPLCSRHSNVDELCRLCTQTSKEKGVKAVSDRSFKTCCSTLT